MRICSFAQESQRYVGYGDVIEFIIPAWSGIEPFQQDIGTTGIFQSGITEAEKYWIGHNFEAAYNYQRLLELGWKPEQARDVLPNCAKTEIWVSTNLREWQQIFKLRDHHTASPQMRELMEPLHIRVSGMIPYVF